jgi:hypothetical protein
VDYVDLLRSHNSNSHPTNLCTQHLILTTTQTYRTLTMPTYEITYQVNRFLDYKVEAESEEDAIKQINDDLVDHHDDYTDYDTSIIHSIKEQTNA